MMDSSKYCRQYFLPPYRCDQWEKKEYIDQAPAWCSVDLRDGNQALVVPMSIEQKVSFFKLLVKIGFKEIEVGFPASSETEYQFLRALIERNLIPEDVTIQVLTQAREHIIKKTFEALEGADHAIIHIYNSLSKIQRERVFEKSRDEIRRIATDGAQLIYDLGKGHGNSYRFEYSPESFTSTEPEFSLEVCNAVLDIWKPTPERKAVINLPSTVETSMPHIYASQVEYLSTNLHYRDNVILSLHPHNDRGTGIADAELGILAGAQRVEGTLFGNGERTGNVDLITLAMNLYSHGVDPGLDFSAMDEICEAYESFTGMPVNERSPYSGALVFAAFSGSHQDAIAKCMNYRAEHNQHIWNVPYLTIDPADIGRSCNADVIRINSQSGKGGVGYILEQHYGLKLPKKMREAMGYAAKAESDLLQEDLQPEEVFELFTSRYENVKLPYDVTEVHFRQNVGMIAEVTTTFNGRRNVVIASGNGRLNAVNNALKKIYHLEYDLDTYEEHALEHSSSSRAIAYVGIKSRNGGMFWGAGVNSDILHASIDALVTAVNNMTMDIR